MSHETIYNVIYAQPRGELKREVIACLRMSRTTCRPRSKKQDRHGQIAELLSIHVHPPAVTDRQFPGQWEGDLIKGLGNASAVGTLVERTTRLLMLVKLPHPHPATAGRLHGVLITLVTHYGALDSTVVRSARRCCSVCSSACISRSSESISDGFTLRPNLKTEQT